MRVSAQRVSQRSRYAWAASSASKRSPCRGRLLRVADAGFDFALAIGIPDPARQRDDAVVGEHIAVERVERRIVDVRGEDALLEVVEDNDAHGPAQPAEGALVERGPDPGTRSPDEEPDRDAGARRRRGPRRGRSGPFCRRMVRVEMCIQNGREWAASGNRVRSEEQARNVTEGQLVLSPSDHGQLIGSVDALELVPVFGVGARQRAEREQPRHEAQEPTQRWLARAAGSLPLVYHEQ